MRKVVVVIDVEDNRAVQEDVGTIDYLQEKFELLSEYGIILSKARIIDDDDKYDNFAARLVDMIFN